MRLPFSNFCTTSERLLSDVGLRCTGPYYGQTSNRIWKTTFTPALNTPETHGAVDVAVNAGVVLLEVRNGGLQKCDMIEGWSGLMCYVAD
jgi:hypothetical protein